jgi:hypothetical protein
VLNAKGGESIMPKQKDRTTTLFFKTFQNFQTIKPKIGRKNKIKKYIYIYISMIVFRELLKPLGIY